MATSDLDTIRASIARELKFLDDAITRGQDAIYALNSSRRALQRILDELGAGRARAALEDTQRRCGAVAAEGSLTTILGRD